VLIIPIHTRTEAPTCPKCYAPEDTVIACRRCGYRYREPKKDKAFGWLALAALLTCLGATTYGAMHPELGGVVRSVYTLDDRVFAAVGCGFGIFTVMVLLAIIVGVVSFVIEQVTQ
jgi:hypothetical protein